MGILKKLFGTDKSVDLVIDRGTSMLDDIIYTKQEKAAGKLKVLDFILAYAKSTSGQNLARRLLAIMIIGGYLLYALIGIIIFPFNPDWSGFIFQFVKELSITVGIIIVFYFGHGVLRDLSNGRKK